VTSIPQSLYIAQALSFAVTSAGPAARKHSNLGLFSDARTRTCMLKDLS
jgi:hypothetical protein